MDIQLAVEARDRQLADSYNAAYYAEDYDASEVIAEIETVYPNIDWKPCYEAIEKNASDAGLDYEDMTDEDIQQIAENSAENLTEQEGFKFDAINEGVTEVAA